MSATVHNACQPKSESKLQTTAQLWRRYYHRDYYRKNANRRRAQRLGSRYGAASEWRLWL